MSKLINADQLSNAIAQTISEYTAEVTKGINDEVDTTAKIVRDEIKATAPVNTGKYAKGFSVKNDNSSGKTNRIIYNRAKPGLVHLLELGHVKRGGKGRVKARPHLQPAYDKHIPKMERNIENIIKKGGR